LTSSSSLFFFIFLFLTVLNESRYTHLPITVAIVPHTVTTDVQQVTVSRGDNQSVEVECLFLQGSEALGCCVEFTRDNEQTIIERISRLNNSFVARDEIALDLALSCYEVFVYDWEADNTTGTVPIPVEIDYVNNTSGERCRTTVSLPPPTESARPSEFRECVCVFVSVYIYSLSITHFCTFHLIIKCQPYLESSILLCFVTTNQWSEGGNGHGMKPASCNSKLLSVLKKS